MRGHAVDVIPSTFAGQDAEAFVYNPFLVMKVGDRLFIRLQMSTVGAAWQHACPRATCIQVRSLPGSIRIGYSEGIGSLTLLLSENKKIRNALISKIEARS